MLTIVLISARSQSKLIEKFSKLTFHSQIPERSCCQNKLFKRRKSITYESAVEASSSIWKSSVFRLINWIFLSGSFNLAFRFRSLLEERCCESGTTLLNAMNTFL